MAGIGEIKVPVKVVQDNPELQGLLRQLIREELMHLDPDVANKMLEQITMRLGRSIQAQTAGRNYEVKTVLISKDSEVVHDGH